MFNYNQLYQSLTIQFTLKEISLLNYTILRIFKRKNFVMIKKKNS